MSRCAYAACPRTAVIDDFSFCRAHRESHEYERVGAVPRKRGRPSAAVRRLAQAAA